LLDENVEIVENIIDENDNENNFMEGEEEMSNEPNDLETEPEDADYGLEYADNTVENPESPSGAEEIDDEDSSYMVPEGDDAMEEDHMMEDQMDPVNMMEDNAPMDGDAIEERTNKGPIILSIGTPRNPFHIYAYEQYNI